MPGSERDASIEAVINWLLENPDMPHADISESDGRDGATAEGNGHHNSTQVN